MITNSRIAFAPDFEPTSDTNVDYNALFTMEDLLAAIQYINTKSTAGHDHISNWVLKHIGVKALKVLLRLFNYCWTRGDIPTSWRMANIIPILKRGKNKSDPKSYRPISILSCLSRLLERLVYNRLYALTELDFKLSETQADSRHAQRQTLDHHIRLTEDILGGSS